jgi:hypothetical protein
MRPRLKCKKKKIYKMNLREVRCEFVSRFIQAQCKVPGYDLIWYVETGEC